MKSDPNQTKKEDGGTDEDSDEGSEASDEDDFDAPIGDSRIYFEDQPVPLSAVRQWGANQLTFILDEQSERLAQTHDQIIDIFKKTEMRMRLFGLPLSEQQQIEENPDEEEEDDTENAPKSNAVYVRIFASELVPLIGDDRSLLSRMFSKTFAVSGKTTLGDIHWHACRFWGLIQSEYSLYVDNPDL